MVEGMQFKHATEEHFYNGQTLVDLPTVREFKLSFKDVPSYVRLDARADIMHLLILDIQTVRAWRSEFKYSYLEDIARKTGLPKTYPDFIKSLIQGLQATDPQTYVDLLDLNDLQLLKGKTPSAKENEDPRVPQKRYFIVTCLVEGRKFHLPLPMSPLDTSQPHLLDKDTVKLLIGKIRETKGSEMGASAQSFFSKSNKSHPSVNENAKLAKKLAMLK